MPFSLRFCPVKRRNGQIKSLHEAHGKSSVTEGGQSVSKSVNGSLLHVRDLFDRQTDDWGANFINEHLTDDVDNLDNNKWNVAGLNYQSH
jgi:hypothetical protein